MAVAPDVRNTKQPTRLLASYHTTTGNVRNSIHSMRADALKQVLNHVAATGKPIPRRVDGNTANRKLPAAPAAMGTAASSCLVVADSTG